MNRLSAKTMIYNNERKKIISDKSCDRCFDHGDSSFRILDTMNLLTSILKETIMSYKRFDFFFFVSNSNWFLIKILFSVRIYTIIQFKIRKGGLNQRPRTQIVSGPLCIPSCLNCFLGAKSVRG